MLVDSSILLQLHRTKAVFDSFYDHIKPTVFSPVSRVSEAVAYSFEAGGKRLRPILCLSSFYSGNSIPENLNFSTEIPAVFYAAFALECIHTYSLIHDDLPAMDNDNLRRGKPTCHVKYDEATAILAGDALNSIAFQSLAFIRSTQTNLVNELIQILYQGAGLSGMILGQMDDILAEKSDLKKTSLDHLTNIHRNKTGALIKASFLLGNRLRADWKDREDILTKYSEEIGLLFQITDDILDMEGSEISLGKTPGKDLQAGKLTYPNLLGLERAKEIREESANKARTLGKFLDTPDSKFFEGLPDYIAKRET